MNGKARRPAKYVASLLTSTSRKCPPKMVTKLLLLAQNTDVLGAPLSEPEPTWSTYLEREEEPPAKDLSPSPCFIHTKHAYTHWDEDWNPGGQPGEKKRTQFFHPTPQMLQLCWLNEVCGFGERAAAPEATSDACGEASAQVHHAHAITICVHTQAKQDLLARSLLWSEQLG